LINFFQKIVRKPHEKEKLCSAQLVLAYATCYEPKLAEEIEMRSTRDRVARGAIIACAPLIITVPNWFSVEWISVPILTIVAIVCLWCRFQKLSASFDAYAWHVMYEKNDLDKKGVAALDRYRPPRPASSQD